MRTQKTGVTKLILLLFLLGGAAFILSPLMVVLWTSFISPDVNIGAGIAAGSLTLANYYEAWQRGAFGLAFINSILVALAVTAFQIVTSALAGYALARLSFQGRQAILLLIIATLVIPFQLLVIPIFFGSQVGTPDRYLLGFDFTYCG